MPPSAPKPPQQPPKVTAVVVIREQLGGTGAAWAYSGDRERAEGIHLRGLVADLQQNANPLQRISMHQLQKTGCPPTRMQIKFRGLDTNPPECKFTHMSIHLRGLTDPQYARLFDSSCCYIWSWVYFWLEVGAMGNGR